MVETQKSDMDKFFDSLDESFTAMAEAIRAGGERGLRFSRRVLNELEEGQRELTTLGRKFSRSPRDLRSVAEAGTDLARRNVANTANLAREWLTGAQETGRDTRETARKVIQANRAAARALGAAVQATSQEIAKTAASRVRPKAKGNSSEPDA